MATTIPHASHLPLGKSGRPDLPPEEATHKLQSQVDIYNGDTKALRHGITIITSHRLCWISSATPIEAALHWHLGSIHSISREEAGFFSGHAKILLRFKALGSDEASPGLVKLSFQAGGRDEVFELLGNLLKRREWAVPLVGPSFKKPDVALSPIVVSSMPGISRIQAEATAKQAEAAALAAGALHDLKSLTEHAKSLVRLAEEYAADAARRRAAAAADSAGAGGAGDDAGSAGGADISSLVTGLGIINPVTRAAAGAQYLEEVARQLAQFLRAPLERSGGLLSLADVYSLYNRARHSDLISPDDLLAAAKLLSPLRLGMTLETLPSRLVVVRLDSFSPLVVATRLQDLLRHRRDRAGAGAFPYVSAIDLAAEWRTPLQVAQQLLLAAEGHGAVCRDDSISGLRFYENKFCA